MSSYTKHLSEPWFSLIKLGIKTCEGRLHKGDFSRMKKGDIIIFENNDFGTKRMCNVKITSTHKYKSFKEYLEHESLTKCLPGIDNMQEGLSVYYKYFTKKDEQEFGIVAIKFKLL